jgi:hypothetical protein
VPQRCTLFSFHIGLTAVAEHNISSDGGSNWRRSLSVADVAAKENHEKRSRIMD